MIVLSSSTQSLIFKLSSSVATNQLEWSASWREWSSSTSQPKSLHGASNNTTEVTLVSAPTTALSHEIVNVTIHNKDTGPATVIVELADGATRRRQSRVVVPSNSTLQFTSATGWTITPEEHNSVVVANMETTGTFEVGTNLTVNGTSLLIGNVSCSADAEVVGDLHVETDFDVSGATTLANTTITGTLTYNAIGAKGDIPAGTADNTLGIRAVGSDYQCLIALASESTGLSYSPRVRMNGAQIADATAWHSSASESSPLYSDTIAAGALNSVRRTVRVRAWGYMSTTGTPTMTLRIKFDDGATSQCIGTPVASSPGSGVTNVPFYIDGVYTVRTTGATGTLEGHQFAEHGSTTSPPSRCQGTITLDLTAAINVVLTAQWSASSASNTITATNMVVEILN